MFFFIGEAAARVMNRRVIRLAAYSSFAMYLLHRITFGIGLSLYEPSTVATSLLYLVGVILPATGVASYAAQRAYDTIAAKVLRAGAQTQSDRPAAVDNADTDWLQ